MSKYFITHVEPVHPLKGTEVLFTIREHDEENKIYQTHNIIKNIPHHFFTKNLSKNELDQLLQELEQNQEIQQIKDEINIDVRQFNQNNYLLKLEGSKEHRKILPAPFICKSDSKDRKDPCSLNSPSKLLQWYYPPLMMVDNLDSIPLPHEIKRRKFIDLESVVNDSYAAIDIEVEGWETGHDQIFMVVYASDKSKIVFHDLPFNQREEHESYKDFQLIQFTSQKDLGIKLTTILHEEDPLWIYGHNIMNYDQLQLRNLTQAYNPATNEHYPVTKSSQGIGRVITKGRFTLDTYTYMFNYLNIFANNKLETIADFEKSISYEEQAQLVKDAKEGDENAFLKLTHYCATDGDITVKTAERFKELVALKSLHFKRDPDSISSSSKLTIADNYWKRRHFLIKGNFRDQWKKHWSKKENFSLDWLKNQDMISSGFQQGIFDDIHTVYLTPFIAAAYKTSYNTRIKQSNLLEVIANPFVRKIKESNSVLEKFDLLQTINAELSFPIEEIDKILSRENQTFNNPPTELTDKQQSALYCVFTYHGMLNLNPLEFIHNTQQVISGTNNALKRLNIINQGNNFHFLDGDIDLKRLEDQFYGLNMGQGKVASVKKGKIIANPFYNEEIEDVNRLIYQGFSIHKGRKTNFEKRMLKTVVEQIFSDVPPNKIKTDLESEIEKFINGDSDQEEYFLPTKTRTYYKNHFRDLIEKTGNKKLIKEFERISNNIGRTYSKQTQKRLHQILEANIEDYSYPYLQEVVETIDHPYPLSIDLIYGDGLSKRLVPTQLFGFIPDLGIYEEKINRQFKDILKILK